MTTVSAAKFNIDGARGGIHKKLAEFDPKDAQGLNKIEATLNALVATATNQATLGAETDFAGIAKLLRQSCERYLPESSPARDRVEAKIKQFNDIESKEKPPRVNIGNAVLASIQVDGGTKTVLQSASTILAKINPAPYSTSSLSAQAVALGTAINQSTVDGKLDSEKFANALTSNSSVRFSEEFIKAATDSLMSTKEDPSIEIRMLLHSPTRTENGKGCDPLISTQLNYGGINFDKEGQKDFDSSQVTPAKAGVLATALGQRIALIKLENDPKKKGHIIKDFITKLGAPEQAYLKKIMASEGAKAEGSQSQVNLSKMASGFVLPLIGGWFFGQIAKLPVLGVFVGLMSGSGIALRSLIPDKQAKELKQMLLDLSERYFGEGNLRKTVDGVVENVLGVAKEKIGA